MPKSAYYYRIQKQRALIAMECARALHSPMRRVFNCGGNCYANGTQLWSWRETNSHLRWPCARVTRRPAGHRSPCDIDWNTITWAAAALVYFAFHKTARANDNESFVYTLDLLFGEKLARDADPRN